jgi:hypothetical protein
MGKPTIEVLGVHSLRVTDEMIREQFRILYGRDPSERSPGDDERHCRAQLESVVLIEVLVRDRDSRFNVNHFAQRREGFDRDNWQVAWAETYLSADGTTVVVEQFGEMPVSGDLRLAFYIHFWDSAKPLYSSYGDVVCPAPSAMPERLEKLVPYELVD